MNALNSFKNQPDDRGHFGQFGGRYVAETLMPLVLELEQEYKRAKADPTFAAQFDDLMEHYVGRPSPLYYAERLTDELRKSAAPGKGAQIWFKRDELNHTGAHKINNCIGRFCWPSAWAKRGSSQKPARANMAWPPPQSRLGSGCLASLRPKPGAATARG